MDGFTVFGIISMTIIGWLVIHGLFAYLSTNVTATAQPGDDNYIAETMEMISSAKSWAEEKKQQTTPQRRDNQMDWINFTLFEKFKSENSITKNDQFAIVVRYRKPEMITTLVGNIRDIEFYQSGLCKAEILEFTPLAAIPRKYTHPIEAASNEQCPRTRKSG